MMTSPALVSIVTPSLNQGRFIEATIASVLAQDYPSIEYLIADGESTDGTLDILLSAGPRLRFTSEPDSGQADAINKGFARLGGEYLAWLNSDDVYLPGAIYAMATYLDAHPECAMVYANADNIDAAGRVLGPAEQVEPFDVLRLLNDIDLIAQPATLFRRTAFEAVGGLDTSMTWAFDYDLWLKLAQSHQIAFIDRVVAQARIHSSAKTATGALPRLLEIERVARRNGRSQIPTGFEAEMISARWKAMVDSVRRLDFAPAMRHARSGLGHLASYATHRRVRRRYGRYVGSRR